MSFQTNLIYPATLKVFEQDVKHELVVQIRSFGMFFMGFSMFDMLLHDLYFK